MQHQGWFQKQDAVGVSWDVWDFCTAEAGDVEDIMGDEANAHACSWDNAAAALSVCYLVSGVSGWCGILGGRAWMVELDLVLKSSVLVLWNRYNGCTSESRSQSTQILDGEDWDWDVEDTTGDEANAWMCSQDNATAALSICHLVSGVSGWCGILGGGAWMVELDLVLKSSVQWLWNRY